MNSIGCCVLAKRHQFKNCIKSKLLDVYLNDMACLMNEFRFPQCIVYCYCIHKNYIGCLLKVAVYYKTSLVQNWIAFFFFLVLSSHSLKYFDGLGKNPSRTNLLRVKISEKLTKGSFLNVCLGEQPSKKNQSTQFIFFLVSSVFFLVCAIVNKII